MKRALLICVLIWLAAAAMWWHSRGRWFAVRGPGFVVACTAGYVMVSHNPESDEPFAWQDVPCYAGSSALSLKTEWRVLGVGVSLTFVQAAAVPLWMPMAAGAMIPAAVWWRKRRRDGAGFDVLPV